VTEIDYQTFIRSKITSIVLPASLPSSLNGDAIFECEKLAAIEVVPESKELIAYNGVLYNKDLTKLIRCPPAKSGVCQIPHTVTTIGDWAFHGCAYLEDVIIPASVKEAGNSAFEGCDKLNKKTLANIRKRFGNSRKVYITLGYHDGSRMNLQKRTEK
jgi:hypothetical protein